MGLWKRGGEGIAVRETDVRFVGDVGFALMLSNFFSRVSRRVFKGTRDLI